MSRIFLFPFDIYFPPFLFLLLFHFLDTFSLFLCYFFIIVVTFIILPHPCPSIFLATFFFFTNLFYSASFFVERWYTPYFAVQTHATFSPLHIHPRQQAQQSIFHSNPLDGQPLCVSCKRWNSLYSLGICNLPRFIYIPYIGKHTNPFFISTLQTGSFSVYLLSAEKLFTLQFRHV